MNKLEIREQIEEIEREWTIARVEIENDEQETIQSLTNHMRTYFNTKRDNCAREFRAQLDALNEMLNE